VHGRPSIRGLWLVGVCAAGEEVRYSSSLACFREIVAREGYRALFRGAGVNIVRGVAGAGVLTSFDRAKAFYISKKQLM